MGISSRVFFLGNQKEVNRYYHAMDYFLLPSFYEGLPGTAVEAQASGLPGIISDTVTKEAIITDLLHSRSIREEPILWAKDIMKKNKEIKECPTTQNLIYQPENRQKYAQQVKRASFDVKEQAVKLQNFYLTGRLLEGEEKLDG